MMKVNFEHVFSDDGDPAAMELIHDNFEPSKTLGKARSEGEIDFFTATIHLPNSKHMDDDDLKPVARAVEHVKRSRPKVFILESDEYIVHHDFGDYLKDHMVDLQCTAGYELTHRVTNAANHGIPHERRRL